MSGSIKTYNVGTGASPVMVASRGIVMTPMGTKPKSTPPTDRTLIGGRKWVPWGSDNKFPQNVVLKSEKSTIIAPAIDKQVRYSYAGGIQAGKISIENGEEIFTPVRDVNFEAFKRKSNLNAYLEEAFKDLYWFANVFPNFILSRDRKNIVQLFVEDACYCRWSWPNKNTGLVEQCYISADWDSNSSPEEDKMVVVDVLDPYFDAVEQIRRGSKYRYLYPISYASPNKYYYQIAPWNGAIASGWLDFSLQIPAFKEAMMRNQISPNYHLEVNEDYWPTLYDNWEKKTDEEKIAAKKSFLDEFQKRLTDTENAGKTLMTQFKYERGGEERVAWRLKALDDKIKSGVYVEDSQEASTHLMNALGLDTALFGNGPGKGFSAGSGSDKNSAYNLYMASIKLHHDKILEPLYIVRDYNGWDPELEFRMKSTFMSGSTSGKPTMEPA